MHVSIIFDKKPLFHVWWDYAIRFYDEWVFQKNNLIDWHMLQRIAKLECSWLKRPFWTFTNKSDESIRDSFPSLSLVDQEWHTITMHQTDDSKASVRARTARWVCILH